MAANTPFDWRASDRRMYLAVAIFFVLIVLIGFGPTYYARFAFDPPPIPSLLVHIHGLVMTLWVAFFVVQVALIRTKNHRVHMNLGMIGVALAIVVLVVGFFTAASAAKYGSPTALPGLPPPLAFSIVPFADLLLFAGLFGAAIYFRKRPADHKRMMLLTVLNFIPPAVARIPIAAFQSLGPLLFFGVPTILAIGLLIYDTRQNRKVNKPFLIGSIVLIASYPIRIILSGTETWLAFAGWITSWAA